jgi:hypothetical protein
MKPREHPPSQSKSHRIVTCAFGVLFVALAIAIFFVSEVSLGSLIAGALVGGLGLDAVLSSVRGKRSLLSRLGPLP